MEDRLIYPRRAFFNVLKDAWASVPRDQYRFAEFQEFLGQPANLPRDRCWQLGFPPLAQYIPEQFNSFEPEYLDLLHRLSKQMPGLSPNIKIISSIPVAASEELYIYRTLETFLKQTLSLEQFEVLLLVNYPKQPTNNPARSLAEATLGKIKLFQRDHPNFPLRVAAVELESPLRHPNDPKSTGINSIGWIRALLADIVVYRYMRARRTDDLLMVRDDADTRWQDERRLATFVNLAEKHPECKAFRGNLRPSLESLVDNPVLSVSEYLNYRVIRRWFKRFGGNEKGGGPNFAVSLAAYCAVGGYRKKTVLSEDGQLSEALHQRGKFKILRACAGAASLDTSTRRGEHALSFRLPSACQWSLGFSELDTHVRLTGEGRGGCKPDDGRAWIDRFDLSFLKEIIAQSFEVAKDLENPGCPESQHRFNNFWRSELCRLGFQLSPASPTAHTGCPEITGFGTFLEKFANFSRTARDSLARRGVAQPTRP